MGLNTYSEGQKNFGLLIIRIGLGVMFILHGYPKIIGGPDKWEKLGSVMSHFNMDYFPVFWGFMAALAEFGGGILIAIGLMFRPATLMLFITMVVAATMHILEGDGIMTASHAIEAAAVFLGLFFTGPGAYRFQKLTIK